MVFLAWGGQMSSARRLGMSLAFYDVESGDFVVPLEAIQAVQAQKVIVDCNKLEHRRYQAIGHAHDAEEPGA
jgi:hypothetical protein